MPRTTTAGPPTGASSARAMSSAVRAVLSPHSSVGVRRRSPRCASPRHACAKPRGLRARILGRCAEAATPSPTERAGAPPLPVRVSIRGVLVKFGRRTPLARGPPRRAASVGPRHPLRGAGSRRCWSLERSLGPSSMALDAPVSPSSLCRLPDPRAARKAGVRALRGRLVV